MPENEQLVATGSDEIRAFLAVHGMPEEDITGYLADGRTPTGASFSFGPDENGTAPRYSVTYTDEVYRLTVEQPA